MPTNVDLPDGHSAVLRDPDELTVRQKRPMKVLLMKLGNRLADVVAAEAEDKPELITELGLSEDEWTTLDRLTDAGIYAFLASWTLDRPVPASMDEVADLPERVYAPLAEAVGKLQADLVAAEQAFTVDGGVEDPQSPTGASAG